MQFRTMILASCATVLLACETAELSDDNAVSQTSTAVETKPSQTAIRNAYFGDVHIHTRHSFDAYIFNVRATPDDAYRFAKGESIKHAAGYDIQLEGSPLDFLAVTDHGEYLGILPAMDDPDHPLSKTAIAQSIFNSTDRANAVQSFQRIGGSFVIGQPIEEINDQAQMNSVWADIKATADDHYEPGKFTTFAGYEFTAMRVISPEIPAAANLHRNVIFRDKAPDQLFTSLDSSNPEDLWDWMDAQRDGGIESLAIPHNSNASNGEMFALETYDKSPITSEWITQRAENEPLTEITQIKGSSDSHPALSPNDEWADFERYEFYIGVTEKSRPSEGSYVRTALARGLAIEEAEGTNPYAFGVIGSSDTHVAAGTFSEEKHWGKTGTDGLPVLRSSVPPNGAETWENAPPPKGRALRAGYFSASGLAGVWADSNTREDIFDAMRRKETFGTSGPRLKVRFFGGADLSEDMLHAANLVEEAYDNGVPMGGDILPEEGEEPAFIAWAMADPLSAPLQRLQIIKVWAEDGELKEAVYDAACSGGVSPDPETHRCADNGARVDVSTCKTTGEGAGELKAFWRDPEYSPNQSVAYYVRALENPTCRWSTWDAIRAGTPPNPDFPPSLQERVWSSPIWVKQP